MKHTKTKISQENRFPEHKIMSQQLKGINTFMKAFIMLFLFQLSICVYFHFWFNPVPLSLAISSIGFLYSYNKEKNEYRISYWKIRERSQDEKE